jgi:HAD superfamily hydrolase (TIGR01509 family)
VTRQLRPGALPGLSTPAGRAAPTDWRARPEGHRAGLLFDLDGTLAQTEHIHLAAFNALLAPSGRSLDDEAFVRHVSGRANDDIMTFLFPDAAAAERLRLADAKEASFRDIAVAGGVALTPGAAELLQWARKRHVATGLVTNAPRANAEMMIAVLGLADAFDVVITADELARSKPHPDPYLAAIETLGLSAAATVAIEDSLTGITAAAAAAIGVIALATAQTAASLMVSDATLVVDDLADARLYDYLRQRFAMA